MEEFRDLAVKNQAELDRIKAEAMASRRALGAASRAEASAKTQARRRYGRRSSTPPSE